MAWKAAQPNDAARRGKWWEVFGDPDLNALEEQVTVSNQTIALAEAQYRGARALVGRRPLGALSHGRASAASVTRSSGVTTQSPGPGQAAPAVTGYEVPVDLSWEIDLFGRIRRSVEAGMANAQASAADLEGVRLAMHAELALDYFVLRGLDAEIELLSKTAAGYQTELELTENRYRQGVVSGVDVAQAKTQLEATRAQATDLGITRAQLEHALAVLVGKTAGGILGRGRPGPDRRRPRSPSGCRPSSSSGGPDIAAAETAGGRGQRPDRRGRGGILPDPESVRDRPDTRARRSPACSRCRTGSGRWERRWPRPIFDGGKRRAAKSRRVAAYDGDGGRVSGDGADRFRAGRGQPRRPADPGRGGPVPGRGRHGSRAALKLANNRYRNGVTSYLEVVTAQNDGAGQRAAGRRSAHAAADGQRQPHQGVGRRVAELGPRGHPRAAFGCRHAGGESSFEVIAAPSSRLVEFGTMGRFFCLPRKAARPTPDIAKPAAIKRTGPAA